MNSWREPVFVVLVTTLMLADALPAGSIWGKRYDRVTAVYADDVAREVGDILTIKIAEDSKVDNKGKRDLKKETSRSSDFNGEMNIDHILPSIPGFTMSAESANELKSKADFKDERTFEDRVSVVVLDVLPNGNLVVSGIGTLRATCRRSKSADLYGRATLRSTTPFEASRSPTFES
jgi:flagellar basal body L-ring protein FlgH